tara:strand:+ start:2867 stop:3262 length:396 start_codon:yes stop_codon:yes gene_type:complete
MTLGELEKLAKKEKETEQKLAATQRQSRRNKLTQSHYHDYDYHDNDHHDRHGRHGRHRRHHHGRHGKHGDHHRKNDRDNQESHTAVDKYGTTSYSQMDNPLPKWGVYLNPIGSDADDNSMWHNIVNSHKDN